jgi:quercetin dioxygenase-like cupin family protein
MTDSAIPALNHLGCARFPLSAFHDLQVIQPQQLFEGVLARADHGEKVTLAVVELDPGAVVPEHSHENEQLGIVLRGSVDFQIGGQERALGPGEMWRIDSGATHVVRAGPDGAVVIDVFGPARDDWRVAERLEPQRPRWP